MATMWLNPSESGKDFTWSEAIEIKRAVEGSPATLCFKPERVTSGA
jgi:hypothetical protein